MIEDDNDGQMIFGDLGGLKFPDICLIGEEKPRKNLTQENCPNRGSNLGPFRVRLACYRLLHSGGHNNNNKSNNNNIDNNNNNNNNNSDNNDINNNALIAIKIYFRVSGICK